MVVPATGKVPLASTALTLLSPAMVAMLMVGGMAANVNPSAMAGLTLPAGSVSVELVVQSPSR